MLEAMVRRVRWVGALAFKATKWLVSAAGHEIATRWYIYLFLLQLIGFGVLGLAVYQRTLFPERTEAISASYAFAGCSVAIMLFVIISQRHHRLLKLTMLCFQSICAIWFYGAILFRLFALAGGTYAAYLDVDGAFLSMATWTSLGDAVSVSPPPIARAIIAIESLLGYLALGLAMAFVGEMALEKATSAPNADQTSKMTE